MNYREKPLIHPNRFNITIRNEVGTINMKRPTITNAKLQYNTAVSPNYQNNNNNNTLLHLPIEQEYLKTAKLYFQPKLAPNRRKDFAIIRKKAKQFSLSTREN